MKQHIFVIAAILTLYSCKRDFDQPNPNAPATSVYWRTESEAISGVNAIYSTFHRSAALYSRWLFYHGILKSDEGYGSGGDIGLNNLVSFVQTDYNQNLTADTWNNLYVGVFRANQVLARVPAIPMDAALKTRLIAEAKFLRGLFYFNLTLYYATPPLVLNPSITTDAPPSSTNEQAWAQVVKDLSEAADSLPAAYTVDDIGRATKGAAYALLGKAYLQQRKYQQALDALNWLVEGAGTANYDLVSNYADNFRINTENNRESVFEIQFAFKSNENTDDDLDETRNPNPGTSIAQFLAPSPGPGGGNGIGFSDGGARRWLIDTFSAESNAVGERDTRLPVSLIFDFADERGPDFTQVYGQSYASRNLPPQGVWFRKLLNDHWKNFEGFSSPNNYRLIRYADVLLMYAECLNGLGRTAEAYQYVDRVRQRTSVNMRPLSIARPGMGQAEFLNQLKHERVLELTGEGWRWADLLRWGDLSPALSARDPEFSNFIMGRHEYYPIPQRDIDLNPNLDQNAGYR
ncbi:MAG: RagB/SusD family nutrient uptake outer membrane protein [Chitinophagaceae bacterium]|nr:RagB/SusD family nutrient uptake outer membrane protein [Chitinophagaceae bacterium]